MIGKGSYLYDETAGAFVGNVDQIGRIDQERDAVDTTTYGSVPHETTIPGIKRSRPLTIRLIYDPEDESVARLIERYESGESADYCLIFPDHATYSFQAFVLALGHETPINDLIRRSYRFRPTGIVPPLLSAVFACGTYYDYSRWFLPGDDYPTAPAGSCPVRYDLSEWITP